MSYPAHLYPVPDPDDEQSPGEGLVPVPQPAPAPVPQLGPELEDADQGDDVDQAAEPDDAEDGEEFEEDEEPRRRALVIPDLSPYYDVRSLKELGPLVVAAGRGSGPPLGRAFDCGGHALLRVLTRAGHVVIVGALCLGRGWYMLLVLLVAWLSGQVGERGSVAARLGIAAAVGYVLATAPAQHPAVPYAMAAGFLLLVIAAGTGRIPEPGSKKKGKKAGEKGKKTDKETTPKGTGGKAKSGSAPGKAAAEGEGVEKEKPKNAPRGGFLGRFARRASGAEQAPAADLTKRPAEAVGDSAGEADADAAETASRIPAEPPLTALLRREIGTENGVHLVDLRPVMRAALPGLSSATDKELRHVLEEAGWDPSKKFRARGHAGRAGVHRNQLPPLPSPGDPQGPPVNHSPPSGDRPRPANSSEAESGGEEGGERPEGGCRIVPAPERGPAAWKVEHDGR